MSMLTRIEPRGLFAWPNAIDRFFADPFFAEPMAAIARTDEGNLALDVSEDEKHVIVRASMPGFKKEDIEVQIDDGMLSIKGSFDEEKEDKGETFYRKERRSGSLSRRVALPSTVVEGETQAELKEGVLTLRMPKAPSSKPRKVTIR